MTGGRAGQQVDDLCRACKAVRRHTVMATGADGEIVRVVCDFCRSEHNFRSGGGVRSAPSPPSSSPRIAEPERSAPPMTATATATETASAEDPEGVAAVLRRVIREEMGLTPVAPNARYRGGQVILRPGNGSADKALPVETFFHKIVMLRNRLRTLEQQVNLSALPEDEKVKLQAYVTACYGTLTTFNVLFADADDHFRGAGGD